MNQLINRIYAIRSNTTKHFLIKLLADGVISGTRLIDRWDEGTNSVNLYKDGKSVGAIDTTPIPRLDAYPVKIFEASTIAIDCTNTFTLPKRDKFEVVVARYKEDAEWTEVIQDNVIVYNKGPEFRNSVALPNEGREYGTYLYHITSEWDNLADRTLFLQGYPWDHPMFPLSSFANEPLPFFSPLNTIRSLVEDTFITARGKEAWWKRWVCTPMPTHAIYGYGAQFSVDRELITRRGKSYWEDLYGLSISARLRVADSDLDNYSIGIMFEHAWPYIFNYRNEPLSEPIEPVAIEPVVTCDLTRSLWRNEDRLKRYGFGIAH